MKQCLKFSNIVSILILQNQTNMTTLFENFYDSLGHEMHIGETVMAVTCGYRIYGHIIDITLDKKNQEKYVIVPDVGCTKGKESSLKKQYKIGWRNVYKVNTKKAC